jgi:hypothetical protein
VPVVVASKTRYSGAVTPSALNTETTVVEIGAQSDDYIVEGYVDLSQLQSGDSVEVREYVAVDGVNYQLYARVTYSGPVSEPVIRFHAKTLLYNMKYKVTIIQISGTLRSFPYGFVLEVLGVA